MPLERVTVTAAVIERDGAFLVTRRQRRIIDPAFAGRDLLREGVVKRVVVREVVGVHPELAVGAVPGTTARGIPRRVRGVVHPAGEPEDQQHLRMLHHDSADEEDGPGEKSERGADRAVFTERNSVRPSFR